MQRQCMVGEDRAFGREDNLFATCVRPKAKRGAIRWGHLSTFTVLVFAGVCCAVKCVTAPSHYRMPTGAFTLVAIVLLSAAAAVVIHGRDLNEHGER